MEALLAALVLFVLALVLGGGLCMTRERNLSPAAPAAGLAAALLVAALAIRLPGDSTTAAGVLVVAALAAGGRLARARRLPLRGEEILLAGAVAAIACLPFVVAGRFGPLGESVNDDLAFHLDWAESLRVDGDAAGRVESGYPVGPHALVAAVARATGLGVEAVFLGLIVTVPVLTALTGLSALRLLSPRLRFVAAGLVGLPYLGAAFLAQGSFKEPILALMVLGFALSVREVVQEQGGTAATIAMVAIVGGCVVDFGLAGFVWPAAVLAGAGLARTAVGLREGMSRVGRPAKVAAVAAVVCAVVLAAAGGLTFFSEGAGRFALRGDRGPGGNLVEALSPLEALGIWPSADFRLEPTASPWLWRSGALLALGVFGFGLVREWFRGERTMVGAALACVAVYLVSALVSLPYFSAKALVILAPLALLMSLLGLLALEPRRLGPRAAWTAVAATYVLSAAASSALALRGATVGADERAAELRTFRPVAAQGGVAFLSRDGYGPIWGLRPVTGATFSAYGDELTWLASLTSGQAKQSADARHPDFDSLSAGHLRRFRFVVTTRSAYASAPPIGFRAARVGRWWILWEQIAPPRARRTLAEGEAPGAVLDCRSPAGRRALMAGGLAFVRPAPLMGPASGWRVGERYAPELSDQGAAVPQATTVRQALRLPPGRWELSLAYLAAQPIELEAGTLKTRLPASLGDAGAFWRAGEVEGGRTLTVSVTTPFRRHLEAARFSAVGPVVAVRTDVRGRTVPIDRACGRYVDWYRPGG